ncbi:hypothetical protein LCGC14_1681500 [marine sediment metagenome]|uniref:Uncharacterized protein n=1 Tax=marine sediment metagenome TaxID=412755 RepID=A0A0F9IAW9_9ZZZZ
MLIRVPNDQVKSLRLALLLIERKMEDNIKTYINDNKNDKVVRKMSREILCMLNNILHQTWRKVRYKNEKRREK